MSIFEKWDKMIDIEGLAADEEEAAKGNREFKEVEPGMYEVAVEQMELKPSKAGDPMLSIWFKIVDGEYKGSMIFLNQVINQGFGLHKADEILRALVSGMDDPIEIGRFSGFDHYNDLVMDIFEAVADNFEYALDYGKNSKGFSTFEITEVFALE